MKLFWAIVIASVVSAALIVAFNDGRRVHDPYYDMEKLRDEIKHSPCLNRVVRGLVDKGEWDDLNYTLKMHEYAKSLCFSKT